MALLQQILRFVWEFHLVLGKDCRLSVQLSHRPSRVGRWTDL